MRHHSLRGLLLAVTCLSTIHASIARAADPGPPALRVDPLVEQFIRGTAIVAARLSPDGKHIAAIARSGLDAFAMLVDVDTHAAHLLAQPVRHAHGAWEPGQVAWVDPSRLVVNYYDRRAELTGGVAYSTAIDLEGHVIAKLGSGTIAIQRDAEGRSTGWVLANRERDGFWVDRINIVTHESFNYTFDVPGRQRLNPVFDARGDILAVRTVDTAFWSDVSRVSTWYRPDTATPWAKVDERSVNDDPFVPVMVSSRPGHLVVLARNGGDRRAAWDYDVARPAFGDRLAADDTDDVDAPRFEAGSSSIVGFVTSGMKPRQIWLDPEMARAQAVVDGEMPDHVNVLSRSGAGDVAVWSYSDTDFGRMSVLDPKTLKMREIFVARPEIDAAHMQPMQVVHYASTDGTDIPAYLTMPGHPAAPAPLIVLVHGGPIARDTWGWHEDVQLFAAHGYAVLQPQFRGSAGFGLRFEEAGYRQWGRKAQDDISAGVRDLV
ncbi:MAG: alpha/beta hydrolase family protein, partial [Burkholderiaceae bacterium]